MANLSKNRFLSLLSIAAFILVLVMNYLAVTQPLNGVKTGSISDKYYNMFTPAGFTFSIWSVIYLFLAIYVTYQAVINFSNRTANLDLNGINSLFIINCLSNASWLIAWHYELLWVSVVIMLIMLFTLIMIHGRLAGPADPLINKLLVNVPFSLYLGWISVATIANITVYLVSNEIDAGDGNIMWANAMIIIATLLGLLMAWLKRNPVFTLVICWGLYGILQKRIDEATAGVNLELLIWICISAMILVSLISMIFNKGSRQMR